MQICLKQWVHCIQKLYQWNEKSLQDLQQGNIDFGFTARELHPTADARLNNLPEGIVKNSVFRPVISCRIGNPRLQEHWSGLRIARSPPL